MSLSPQRRSRNPNHHHYNNDNSITSQQPQSSPNTMNIHHHHNNHDGIGTLSKMIEAAAIGKHHVKWSHVLHYLKAQCIVKEEEVDDDDDDDDDNMSDDNNNNNNNKSNMNHNTMTRTKKRQQQQQQQYPFDIPFQRYYTASPDLLVELAPTTTTKTTTTTSSQQSILRTTIGYGTVVPLSILQALCYLGPLAITQIDPCTGRMLLHTTCRFPSFQPPLKQSNNKNQNNSAGTSLESMIELLIAAYPSALVHRDHDGCTPLHYLFMYHAPQRTHQLCQLLLYNFIQNKHLFFTLRQPIRTTTTTTNNNNGSKTPPDKHSYNKQQHPLPPLPDIPRPTQQNKLPCNAAIIPDAIHGCIPLHYALMYGANYDVIQTLITAYPASKHVVDRYNHTPIHYLFGATVLFVHTNNNNNKNDSENTNNNNNSNNNDEHHYPTAITGETLPSWNYCSNNNNNNTNDETRTAGTMTTLLQQQKIISNHYYYYYDYFYKQQHQQQHHHSTTGSMNTQLIMIVQLLLTSRVSRTVDAIDQRCPLHTLAIYIAHQTFLMNTGSNNDGGGGGGGSSGIIADNNGPNHDNDTHTNELIVIVQLFINSYAKQCQCQDRYGMTPIVLLLDTVQQLQYRIYMEQCYRYNCNDTTDFDRNNLSVMSSRQQQQQPRRQLSCGYTPSIQIIQLLIQAVPSMINTTTSMNMMNISNSGSSDHNTKSGGVTEDDTSTCRIVAIEDHDGRLPIHIALQIAISPEIVNLFISAYPTCLIHTTTNEIWCPLHTAFTCHYTAHLQSIDTVHVLLFHSYQAGKYGTTVDGRLAMKMEDTYGYYPIHYACQNNASSSVISLFIERYSHCCFQQKPNDDLPIHCIVQNLHPDLLRHILFDVIVHTTNNNNNNNDNNIDTTTTNNNIDNTNSSCAHTEYIHELIIEVRTKLNVLLRPLILSDDKAAKDKLCIADSIAGMLPLHIAVLFQTLEYPMLFKMLQLYPYSAMQYTNNLQTLLRSTYPNMIIQQEQPVEDVVDVQVSNVHSYSAIDLHDICHQRLDFVVQVYNDIEWYRIRELLFSFGPTLESHRHRQDLLDHGVQIIVDELLYHEQQLQQLDEEVHDTTDEDNNDNEPNQNDNLATGTSSTNRVLPGYHYIAINSMHSLLPDLQITHSVSIMEEELGLRPRFPRRRRRGKVSKRLPPNKSRHHPHQQPSSSAASSGSHLNRTNTLTNGPTSGSDTLTSADYGSRVIQLDLQLKTNSSIYDDDDGRFIHDLDDNDNESYISGDDVDSANDDSYISDEDDDGETYTDGYDTQDSDARESMSQETTSRSRLRTTFEDGEEDESENESLVETVSDDGTSRRGTTFDDDAETDTRSYDEETVSTTGRSRNRQIALSGTNTSTFTRRNRIDTTTGGTDSRRVTFDDDSTVLSGQRKSFDIDSGVRSVGSFFGIPREHPTLDEEKKDEFVDPELPSTPRTANKRMKAIAYQRPPYMSEVGMRIWTFFVMYCDINNPKDNYADKLSKIVAAVKFSTWEELVSCPLPPYTKNYTKNGMEIDGLSFRDIASPKCRALIHKTSHFLGKYDFRSDHNILVYRTTRDDMVMVEASEWLYTTEATTNAKNPGISEEKIWSTGEVPAEIGVTFETHQRPVWIKFTKNSSEYNNEIDSRIRLGISVDEEAVKSTGNDVIPILQHFNAISTVRKHDKNYSIQRTDERFKSLQLINGSTSERKVQLLLHEYPFVIVYPAPLRGTLYDYFLKHGISQTSECKLIVNQLAHALGFLHSNGICHGNICMRNVVSVDSNTSDGPFWGFLNLSCATFADKSNRQYLGGIDLNGFALFETETLPPEMFTKLTANELKDYLAYWAEVEKRFNVTIDRNLINPAFDMSSGSIYVVKCHFIPLTVGENDVRLPYQLVEADTSSDFWALGQLLFVLYTGRNIFQVSARDGRLFDYVGMCNWDGCSLIYEHVDDELVQDVLLLCLALNETRQVLTVTDLLHHPFLTGDVLPKKVSEARQLESALHKRTLMKKLHDVSEQNWLDERSITIHCWNFDILERFHHSPTEVVKKLLSRKVEVLIPCSALLLPYDPFDLTDGNNYADDAERMGIELLELSKVCHFCAVMKQAILKSKSNNKNGWSLIELEKQKIFPSSSFDAIQFNMRDLASRHVEEFRRNPLAVAMKLITRQIEQVYKCFENRSMYLYLIDEYSLVPTSYSSNRTSVSVNQRLNLFTNVLPLTHLYLQYVRGVTKGLAGLSKLLLPNSQHDTPHSWMMTEAGLSNSFAMNTWTDEMIVLIGAQELADTSPHCISDNLSVVRDYLLEVDPRRDVGGLKRVVVADTCLWTNQDGAKELDDSARSHTFFDALHIHRI